MIKLKINMAPTQHCYSQTLDSLMHTKILVKIKKCLTLVIILLGQNVMIQTNQWLVK